MQLVQSRSNHAPIGGILEYDVCAWHLYLGSGLWGFGCVWVDFGFVLPIQPAWKYDLHIELAQVVHAVVVVWSFVCGTGCLLLFVSWGAGDAVKVALPV